jgi:hypothetical protein
MKSVSSKRMTQLLCLRQRLSSMHDDQVEFSLDILDARPSREEDCLSICRRTLRLLRLIEERLEERRVEPLDWELSSLTAELEARRAAEYASMVEELLDVQRRMDAVANPGVLVRA